MPPTTSARPARRAASRSRRRRETGAAPGRSPPRSAGRSSANRPAAGQRAARGAKAVLQAGHGQAEQPPPAAGAAAWWASGSSCERRALARLLQLAAFALHQALAQAAARARAEERAGHASPGRSPSPAAGNSGQTWWPEPSCARQQQGAIDRTYTRGMDVPTELASGALCARGVRGARSSGCVMAKSILRKEVLTEEGDDALVHGGQLGAVEAGRDRRADRPRPIRGRRAGGRGESSAEWPPVGMSATSSQRGRQACSTRSLWKRGASQESLPAVTRPRGTAGRASEAGSKSTAKGTPATTAAIRGSACAYQDSSFSRRRITDRATVFFTSSRKLPCSCSDQADAAGEVLVDVRLAVAAQLRRGPAAAGQRQRRVPACRHAVHAHALQRHQRREARVCGPRRRSHARPPAAAASSSRARASDWSLAVVAAVLRHGDHEAGSPARGPGPSAPRARRRSHARRSPGGRCRGRAARPPPAPGGRARAAPARRPGRWDRRR